MSTIFDIAEDMRALDDLLTECGGDISDPDAMVALDAFLMELESDLEGKVERYVRLCKELEARSAARKEEARRIAHRAKVDAASAAGLKRRLLDALLVMDRTRVETATFKVTVGKAGGKLPLVIDEGEIPEEYICRKVSESPDTDAIRAALDSGTTLPFATYGSRAVTLRVR